MRKSENSYAKVILRPCISTDEEFRTQQFASTPKFTTLHLKYGGAYCCVQNAITVIRIIIFIIIIIIIIIIIVQKSTLWTNKEQSWRILSGR